MMKRWIPVLMLAVLVANAPSAMAGCFKCDPRNPPKCILVGAGQLGATECEDGVGDEPCIYWGEWCYGGQGFAAEAFDAEFQVVAVERIDGAQPAASETRIAVLETPRPATQH